MPRILLAISIAIAIVPSSARAECDGAGPAIAPGIVKDTVAGENGTVSKRGDAPTGGPAAPAPVKAKPLSRAQVRLAGSHLGIERAC